jgi:DNA-binding MarR family transcriptional regulator
VPLARPLNVHDQHTHRILTEIEASKRLSQRDLSRSLGIALGLTNLLLRRLVRKGWVRMVQVKPNRVMYLLTPVGTLQKAKMSRAYLASSVQFYAEARTRISQRFAALSAEWPAGDGNNGDSKRIVFYGAGELAEIAFICLQGSDLELVGVVDDSTRTRFFDVPVYSIAELKGRQIQGRMFDRLIVMTIEENESTQAILEASEVPVDRICWL